MQFYLPLVVGVMFPLRVTFVVFPHICVDPIYMVNIVAAVQICVHIYVGLLPHILEWSYQLFIYGNPTSI